MANEKKLVWSTENVKEAEQKLDEGIILKGYEIPFFDKIPGLKKSNLAFKVTEEELNEYMKCKVDIRYFIANYCYIKSEDGDYHLMKLRDYQHDVIDLYDKNPLSILMASRQIGKCVDPLTEVKIIDKTDNNYIMPFFRLLYKSKVSKTIYDHIKYVLYSLLYKLS